MMFKRSASTSALATSAPIVADVSRVSDETDLWLHIADDDMAAIAEAVSRCESGLLVYDDYVIDLSSGMTIMVEADSGIAAPTNPHDEAEPATYQGTDVLITRLEAIANAVEEALAERERDPSPATMHPKTARRTFPWGLGITVPDVLVGGEHAPIVAAYLRSRGKRSRVAPIAAITERALDFIDAKEELARRIDAFDADITPVPMVDKPPAEQQDAAPADAIIRGPATQRWPRRTLLVAGAAAVVMGVAAVAVIHLASAPSEVVSADSPAVSTGELSPTLNPVPSPTLSPKPSTTPSPPSFREQHLSDSAEGQPTFTTARATVPVGVHSPQWRRVAATAQREEFHTDDPGIRVLVAAKPTPLTSQEELDASLVQALEQVQDVRLSSTAPVVYWEEYPETTTVWHVLWVPGYQLSVGCQMRERTPHRELSCAEAVDKAHVDQP